MFFSQNIVAQSFDVNSFKQSKNIDSLIRISVEEKISTSYFVITYPTIGATTSWAPQFIEIYEKIKSRDEDILLVLMNSGGFRKKDLKYFLKESLKLDSGDINKIRLILNDSLYFSLNSGKHLVRLQYYYRGRQLYNEAEKWHKSDVKIFIPESITLGLPEKKLITSIDDKLLKERDPVFVFDSSNLLILTDTKNEVLLLNRSTGITNTIISRQDLQSATEYYCRYITKGDTSKCNFAKQNAKSIEETMRKTVSIDGLKVIGKDSILLFVNIEVYERNLEEFKFINDEGDKATFKKGEPSLNLYSFVVLFDVRTSVSKSWLLQELPSTKKEDKYLMPELGIQMSDSGLFTTAVGYGTKDENTISVLFLKFDTKSLNYHKTTGPSNLFNPKLYMYHNKNLFFTMFNQNYFMYNCDNNLYLVGRENPQSAFIGDGSAPYALEAFKTYFEANLTERINFDIQAVSPILSEKYLAALMVYKGEPVLEIKNRMFKTIDILPLNQHEELSTYFKNPFRTDIKIINNSIVFKLIENDEVYLISIPIKEKQTANTK